MYASGGKNVPAGMAVVIVRESWLTSTAVHPMCPQVLDYRKTAGGRMPTPSIFQSLPNTPPIFAAYMLGHLLGVLGARGGLAAVVGEVLAKAAKVYLAIDDSGGFYYNGVDKAYRSQMNAPFRIGTAADGTPGDRALERAFVEEAAAEAGCHYLFGHPVKGGVRVTQTEAAIDAVVAFARPSRPSTRARRRKRGRALRVPDGMGYGGWAREGARPRAARAGVAAPPLRAAGDDVG